MNLIETALQESNDIESHSDFKVNSKRDLEDSLLAWDFITDIEHPYANYPSPLTVEKICFVQWLITRRQLNEDSRGILRSQNGFQIMTDNGPGAKPSLIPDLLYQWLRELPIMSPKETHIRFEKIHPFVDGNGRTGRMIYYWQLKKLGDLNTYRIIYDIDRLDYYRWFGKQSI